VQGTGVRDALMVALRYDRSAAVRQKALEGLQPYVAEDMQVRDAVLETLLNDPDAHIRSAAIDAGAGRSRHQRATGLVNGGTFGSEFPYQECIAGGLSRRVLEVQSRSSGDT
jgi:hypothetical protein